MEMYYEEVMREIKNGKVSGENLEYAYSNFKKLLEFAEEEESALRRLCNTLDSDNIAMLLRKKRQEVEALEEIVSIIRRQL